MSKNWRGEISFPVGEIYRARLARRITTQAILAEQVGIRREIVVDAEKGKHISAEHAKAISNLLNLDLSNYLKEEDYGGLFGRNLEIMQILRAMDSPGPVRYIVLGGPGIGKTACTQAVANVARAAERYPAQRMWFVGLGTANSAESAKVLIAMALGLDPATTTFEDALQVLRERPGLLILDNLETPWEGDTERLVEILDLIFREAPKVAILGSMRGRESPPAAWTTKVLLAPLSVGASSTMFRSIATLIAQRDPHLGYFLRVLGGMPLAIKLVAQRAEPYQSLARYWEEWNERDSGIALAANPDLPEGRETSVLRSVEFSLRSSRLAESGRRLFRLLGRAPAGMALRDCGSLLGLEARSAERQLLAVGLAEPRADRLDLLPPVRDAAGLLMPLGLDEEVQWCSYYIRLVNDHGPLIGRKGGREAAAMLAPEIANLESALLFSAGPAPHAIDLLATAPDAISGIAKLVSYTGYSTSNILNDLARSFEHRSDFARMAQCLTQDADHAVRRSEFERAEKIYRRTMPIFLQLDDMAAVAHCLEWLSDAARERRDYKSAKMLCADAIAMYNDAIECGQLMNGIDGTGTELGLADAYWSSGELSRFESHWDQAEQHYQTALSIFERYHSLRGKANCARGLAYVLLGRADHARAMTEFLSALNIYEEIGLPLALGHCHYGIGKIYHIKEEFQTAQHHYEIALKLFKQVRNARYVENCHARAAAARQSAPITDEQS